MPRKRHSAGQIVAKLRQIDVLIAQGRTIGQACKDAEIAEHSYHRWRNEYGGQEMEQARCRFSMLLLIAPLRPCSDVSFDGLGVTHRGPGLYR